MIQASCGFTRFQAQRGRASLQIGRVFPRRSTLYNLLLCSQASCTAQESAWDLENRFILTSRSPRYQLVVPAHCQP